MTCSCTSHTAASSSSSSSSTAGRGATSLLLQVLWQRQQLTPDVPLSVHKPPALKHGHEPVLLKHRLQTKAPNALSAMCLSLCCCCCCWLVRKCVNCELRILKAIQSPCHALWRLLLVLPLRVAAAQLQHAQRHLADSFSSCNFDSLGVGSCNASK
jgi:hypothetical protein